MGYNWIQQDFSSGKIDSITFVFFILGGVPYIKIEGSILRKSRTGINFVGPHFADVRLYNPAKHVFFVGIHLFRWLVISLLKCNPTLNEYLLAKAPCWFITSSFGAVKPMFVDGRPNALMPVAFLAKSTATLSDGLPSRNLTWQWNISVYISLDMISQNKFFYHREAPRSGVCKQYIYITYLIHSW